ncbi:hypothetical protein Droror1_Dr00026319 [Drosera rotundifolia]
MFSPNFISSRLTLYQKLVPNFSSMEPLTIPQPSTTTDIFESTITLDETNISQGYSDGYTTGLTLGLNSGRSLGRTHGFKLGEELGFYKGIIVVWESTMRVDPGWGSGRVRRMVRQIGELIDGWGEGGGEEEGEEVRRAVRGKFRAVCGSLGVKGFEYDGLGDGGGDDAEF